jgi:GntR family transcriptional regulator
MIKNSIKPARVDPLSAIPKYYQLAEILRQKIENNEWPPHDPLPAERELEIRYQVSRTTVREALNHLASQGYIYREHGRGTFVGRPKVQQNLHLLQSFTDDIQTRGFIPGQRILQIAWGTPSECIKQKLELTAETDQVLQIERLRYADNEPIGIHVSYFSLPAHQTITVEELQSYGSLYALLETKFNLSPYEADETLEATNAKAHEAALLGIKEGDALLLLERTTFSFQRQPMEFVKMLYRADRYKFYFHLSR